MRIPKYSWVAGICRWVFVNKERAGRACRENLMINYCARCSRIVNPSSDPTCYSFVGVCLCRKCRGEMHQNELTHRCIDADDREGSLLDTGGWYGRPV